MLQVEAAVAAKVKAEEAAAALRQAHKAELEAEKSHYEGLLQRARAAQVRPLHYPPLCHLISQPLAHSLQAPFSAVHNNVDNKMHASTP